MIDCAFRFWHWLKRPLATLRAVLLLLLLLLLVFLLPLLQFLLAGRFFDNVSVIIKLGALVLVTGPFVDAIPDLHGPLGVEDVALGLKLLGQLLLPVLVTGEIKRRRERHDHVSAFINER